MLNVYITNQTRTKGIVIIDKRKKRRMIKAKKPAMLASKGWRTRVSTEPPLLHGLTKMGSNAIN